MGLSSGQSSATTARYRSSSASSAAPPAPRERVVDPARIIRPGRRRNLGDEPGAEHPPDRAVERPRPHLHPRTRIGLDLLHDRVAVPLPVGERHEDVEHGWRERSGHAASMYPSRIYVKRVR